MAKWERRDVTVRTNATGHELTAPVFVARGRQERPLAYVQANVHGGELQGNAAILALFELLEREPLRGTVILVPRVNPVSANQQVGDYVAGVYDFLTGNNFNRGYLYLTGPSRSASAACYVDVDSFATAHQSSPVGEIREGFRESLKAALDAIEKETLAWGADSRLEFALAIQRMAVEADLVLDLHTGDRAPRYLYVPGGRRRRRAGPSVFRSSSRSRPGSAARSTRPPSSPGRTSRTPSGASAATTSRASSTASRSSSAR